MQLDKGRKFEYGDFVYLKSDPNKTFKVKDYGNMGKVEIESTNNGSRNAAYENELEFIMDFEMKRKAIEEDTQ